MHASISETAVAVCHHLQQMSRWHKPVRQTGGGRLAAMHYATGSALGTALAQFSYDTTPSAAILVEQPLPPYVTVLWPHLSDDCRPLWIPPIQSTYWPAGSTPMDMRSSNKASARTAREGGPAGKMRGAARKEAIELFHGARRRRRSPRPSPSLVSSTSSPSALASSASASLSALASSGSAFPSALASSPSAFASFASSPWSSGRAEPPCVRARARA